MNAATATANKPADAEIETFAQHVARHVLKARESEIFVTLAETELALIVAESLKVFNRR